MAAANYVVAQTVTNSDGSLTAIPAYGNVVVSLAASHSNTWTAQQTISGAILEIEGSNPSLNINATGTAISNAWNLVTSSTGISLTYSGGIIGLALTTGGGLNLTNSSQAITLNIDTSGNTTAAGYVSHHGERAHINAQTSAYTATANDDVITCSASSAAFTVTLPAATGTGAKLLIVKTDSSSNAITVSPSGTDTIEGSTSKSISSQYGKLGLVDAASGLWLDLSTGGGL